MGTVEGELRCVVCYAAPDWPIIEAECEASGLTTAERADALGGRPQVRGPALPRPTLDRAIEMRADGMTWAEIARALGVRMRAIQQATLRYERAGRVARKRGRPMKTLDVRSITVLPVRNE